MDDPDRRLESASSDLELALLLVFTKPAAHRAQQEYRFLVWAENEPADDVLDLDISPALVDAMRKPRPEPEDSGFVRPGAAEYSAVDELGGGGSSRARAGVETLPAFVGAGKPTVALRSQDAETLPGDLRETATVRAAVEALHEAVDTAEAAYRKDAAAPAWHAEPVLRFICATFGRGIAGMRVNEDGFIVVTAELSPAGAVEASIAVGTGGDLRVHGQCRRHASRVHGAGRAVLRAGSRGAPGGGRRAGSGQ